MLPQLIFSHPLTSSQQAGDGIRFYLLSDTVVLNVGNLQQVLTVIVRRFVKSTKKLPLFGPRNEARRNYAASTNILPPSHE